MHACIITHSSAQITRRELTEFVASNKLFGASEETILSLRARGAGVCATQMYLKIIAVFTNGSGAGRRHSRNFIWRCCWKKKLSERSGARVWNDIALAAFLARSLGEHLISAENFDRRAPTRPAVLSNLFPDTHSEIDREREKHLISHSRALLFWALWENASGELPFSINQSLVTNNNGKCTKRVFVIFVWGEKITRTISGHLIYYSGYSCL
jgi:hypothetical protein